LLGDVFDLWAMPFAEIRKNYSQLFFALDCVSAPIIYVPGNHDDQFKGLRRLDNWMVTDHVYRFTSGGKAFVAVHGDAYDNLKGTPSRVGAWFSRLVDRIAAWFAGPGVSITRAVRTSFAEIGPGRETYVRPLHERAVADIDCDYLIIGHTHVPVPGDDIGKTRVIGTGDFGPEHMTYVIVENGEATLHEIG